MERRNHSVPQVDWILEGTTSFWIQDPTCEQLARLPDAAREEGFCADVLVDVSNSGATVYLHPIVVERVSEAKTIGES